jgi:hypothetical protein
LILPTLESLGNLRESPNFTNLSESSTRARDDEEKIPRR